MFSRFFGWKLCSAMSRKLALKTGLQGDVITLWAVEADAPWEQNQRSHWAQNPRSWAASSRLFKSWRWMTLYDAQKLGKTGLLEAEAIPTVICKRNEVEAATEADVQTQRALSLEHPSRFESNFRMCFPRLVSVTIPQPVTHNGDTAFENCEDLPGRSWWSKLNLGGIQQWQSIPNLKKFEKVFLNNALFGACKENAPLQWPGVLRFLGFQRVFRCKSGPWERKVLKGTNREQSVTKQLLSPIGSININHM